MTMIATPSGLVDETTLKWKLYRDDRGDAWHIVHELRNDNGELVRADLWRNVKSGIDESMLCWRLWREDRGESWTFVHELTDREGTVVRRDAWVNFKANGIASSTQQGGLG